MYFLVILLVFIVIILIKYRKRISHYGISTGKNTTSTIDTNLTNEETNHKGVYRNPVYQYDDIYNDYW